MATTEGLRTIRTQVPARLDRLPWSRFHWRIVVALGTVWILDGLEVTIVGSVAARMTEAGSGIELTPADIGYAAAIYVTGACLGALLFGQLTDRFGRKRLMIITLGLYVLATIATAFSFAPWYFFLCRFFTGMGIGGEYSAVNSAIDELIPARNRGQVNITINGSYWVGSAIGSLVALWLLSDVFAFDLGWRIAFGAGGLLGFTILLLRRHVPESPRWLFIHGREDEAEAIADGVEREVREETHQQLSEPESSIIVRQRHSIPFREIIKVAVKLYPKRSVLGLALFVGQAFLYNAVTFDLGTLLNEFFAVASSQVPYFMVIFAVGNFLGPLLLGRLFDTVGRKPMITATYLTSSALTIAMAILLTTGGLNRWSFIALLGVTFFFASAGASSAYLTVSEIFPMETRALAIAVFYAIGTGLGGIIGPLLFGSLINTGEASLVAIGFAVGAAIMAIAGFVEIVFGVRSEGVSLENIAKPLTTADAAEPGEHEPPQEGRRLGADRRAALALRERAEEERTRAAEHLALAHQLSAETPDESADDSRIEAERVLAEVSQLRAEHLHQLATSHDERAAAEDTDTDPERRAALARARAAHDEATSAEERAKAITAEQRSDSEYHAKLADGARERVRAAEQREFAENARGEAEQAEGTAAELPRFRAEMHQEWAQMHDEWAAASAAEADGDQRGADEHRRNADNRYERALGMEQQVEAARHRVEARQLRERQGQAEDSERQARDAALREERIREREERIRQRIMRRTHRNRSGLRRFRPGPGSAMYSPGMIGTASHWAPTAAEEDLDREIISLEQALRERGPLNRAELATAVGARYWGPGRFRAAVLEAVHEGRIRRLSRDSYGPAEISAAL